MKPKILISGTGACENYAAAVEAAGGLPVVACCPQFSLDYDGLLLTGGGDIAPDLFGQELDGSADIDRDRDMAELELLGGFRRPCFPGIFLKYLSKCLYINLWHCFPPFLSALNLSKKLFPTWEQF